MPPGGYGVCLEVVLSAVDSLVCRDLGVRAERAQHVERELHLGQQLVPQIGKKVLNGALRTVGAVVVGRHKLHGDILLSHKLLQYPTGLIVQALHGWLVPESL